MLPVSLVFAIDRVAVIWRRASGHAAGQLPINAD